MNATRQVDGPSGVHLSARQLAGYAGRKLPPVELLEVDDHLVACEHCRTALAGIWDGAPAAAAWRGIVTGEEPAAEPVGPAQPAPRRRSAGGLPRWAWPLAASLLLVAGLGAVLREAAVSRERTRLEGRVREARQASARLGPEVERLRAENRALQQEVERLGAAVPPSPAVVRLLDQGRPVELAADGSLRGLADMAPAWRSAVARALSQGALAVPWTLWEARAPASTLRSGEPEAATFALVGPVGTVVRSDRPRFRWIPLQGAASYRVVLSDAQYRPVQESGEVTGTEWTPPRPLPRGEMLSWQVVARRGDEEVSAPAPPTPEARLLILSRAEKAALEQAEAKAAGSHLAHAVLLAQAGLLEEARAELAALERENPGSPVVGRLVRGLAGR